MFAIRLDSSFEGMKVWVFKRGDVWGRAEHIVRIFAYFSEAEEALQAHVLEIKERIKYRAPEITVYERGILARLEKAEIVFADDVPDFTAGGVAFIRQLSDDQRV